MMHTRCASVAWLPLRDAAGSSARIMAASATLAAQGLRGARCRGLGCGDEKNAARDVHSARQVRTFQKRDGVHDSDESLRASRAISPFVRASPQSEKKVKTPQ
jgi:hypothetical protein